jgi:hypothetical protein
MDVAYMEETESDDDLRSIDHGGYEHQFERWSSLTRPMRCCSRSCDGCAGVSKMTM